MIELIITGIVTGFLLSVMIGPVFFVLLETSIRRGVRAAIAFNLGVILSDIIYISIAYFFYSTVSTFASGKNQEIIRIVGGCIFVIYGIIILFKKTKKDTSSEIGNVLQTKSDLLVLTGKGFLLNFANPLVIFYWLSVVTFADKNYSGNGNSENAILVFIAITLFTFFSVDLLKIFGAKKLRPLVTDKVLRGLNLLIGLVFGAFGAFLVIKGIINHS